MLLSDAIKLFLKQKHLQGLQDKSIVDYTSFIILFIKSIGDLDIKSLSPSLVEDYMLSLYNRDRSLSKTSIATYLRHLKVFLRFIESYPQIRKNIKSSLLKDTRHPFSEVIKIPKVYRRKVDILSANQIQQIFDAVYVKGNLIKTRNALIIALMLDCGLRREEVVKLTTTRINYITKKITVLGKGEKERIVPIGNFTFNLIIEYRSLLAAKNKNASEYTALLLTRSYTPITNNTIKIMVNNLRKSLGIKFSAHTLRHNFATNWCIDEYSRCGTIDVFRLQVLMGHQDIQTTLIYVHMAEEIIIASSSISHLDYININIDVS